jgi:hypothetical protein
VGLFQVVQMERQKHQLHIQDPLLSPFATVTYNGQQVCEVCQQCISSSCHYIYIVGTGGRFQKWPINGGWTSYRVV